MKIVADHKFLKCVFNIKIYVRGCYVGASNLKNNIILRYITLPDKTIPHAGSLFSIHKSKGTEEGERGEESASRQQADRASDDDGSPDVGQQKHAASDEKPEISHR